ncbi:hypothetical protein [Chryseobacterium sp. MFBS3-17]|uniref:hypothetical protein n=1 Tax=Chryseobacterium sp. MFBS3-17 TaxID=2886689 RepID=UPI001D0E407E|nr:hypothetical protein [Chryseobacterium sp. MFBS3-17]MCC2590335.1 hypothetical protein [Chryseobacterium sp. MFBS3-17]
MENKQKSSNEAHSEQLQQCNVSRSATFKKYAWHLAVVRKPKEGRNCNIEIWIEIDGKRKSAVARDYIYSKGIFRNEIENIEFSRYDENLKMWQYSDN